MVIEDDNLLFQNEISMNITQDSNEDIENVFTSKMSIMD